MRKVQLGGVVAALLTPFDQDGAVSLPSLRNHTELLEATGIDAFCVGGHMGELAGAEAPEYQQVCRTVVAATGKPVIAGVYPDSTPEAVALARAASSAGASAILLAQPHYLFQPRSCDLPAYFQTIRNAVSVPVWFSNTLARSLTRVDTIRELAAEGLIDGVVQGAGNVHLLADLLSLETPLPVLSGIDEMIFVAHLLGAQGTLTSLACVFPRECVALNAALQRNDFECAREIHERLLRVWRAANDPAEGIARLKLACEVRGNPLGVPRAPYAEVEPERAEFMRTTLAREGLI